ncbi:MAG: glycosyltransferase family 4 protein [Actinobacteria bacterium]|nr:glycosyltransferase family 4 protein [Actinomycetota bacterium]
MRPVAYAASWRGRHDLPARLPVGTRAVGRPMAARPLRELWRRLDAPPVQCWTGPVEVVHGTNYVVPPARRAGRVVTVHDLTPVRFPELATRDTLQYPDLVRRAVARGALVHTDSSFVAEEVRDWLGVAEDRVVPVLLGLAPQQVGDPAAGRRRLFGEAGSDRRYLLAVGTVEPRKDLPGLVAAFDAIASTVDDLHLVIAGPDGWGADALDRAIAASPAAARIHRLGWVDDAVRADLLAGATAVAYPSRYEGFGFVPLEAMAAGVPVVCTDAGSLPEVVADAALTVPVGDVGALADAILLLSTDETRRADLVGRGRHRAAGFSWDRCAAGLVALYRRAAEETSCTRS